MDYIEKYKKAHRNDFASDEDKDIQKKFPQLARKDILWARKNNLIKEMSFEDYMESQAKQRYTEITPAMRKVILSELDIPVWIISQYYDLPPTTVQNIRRKAKWKEKMKREEASC